MGPNISPQLWRRLWHGALLFVITVVALAMRLQKVPTGLPFVDTDSELHMKRAEAVFAGGPFALGRRDMDINWPTGVHVAWPPGYDLFLAALGQVPWIHEDPRLDAEAAYVIKKGKVTPREVEMERYDTIAGISTAVLGSFTMVLAYYFCRVVLGATGALLCTFALAFLPAHVELSRAGRVDHHVLEPMFLWTALALLWTAAGRSFATSGSAHAGRRVYGPAICAGLCIAALVFSVPSAMLGVSLFLAAGLVLLPTGAAPAAAVAFGSGTVALFVLALLPFGAPLFSLEEPSMLQPLLMLLAAAAAALWSRRRKAAVACMAGIAIVGGMFGYATGLFDFAAQRGIFGTIIESKGLLSFGLQAALAPFSALLLIAPIALAVTFYRGLRGSGTLGDRRGDPAKLRLTMAVLCAALLGITLLQRRFMHLASLPFLVVMVDAAKAIPRPAWSVNPLAWLASHSVALVVVALAGIPVYRYLLDEEKLHPRLPAVMMMSHRLGRLAPGAVLSQWPYGHVIARRSGHPVVASPLLTADTVGAVEEATAALLAPDESAALALMRRRNVRYVIATDVALPALARFLEALDDKRSAEEVRRHSFFAALMARKDIPGFKYLASSIDERAKLYERVAIGSSVAAAP